MQRCAVSRCRFVGGIRMEQVEAAVTDLVHECIDAQCANLGEDFVVEGYTISHPRTDLLLVTLLGARRGEEQGLPALRVVPGPQVPETVSVNLAITRQRQPQPQPQGSPMGRPVASRN